MSQGSWQNMAYSLPMVPLNMAGQWADREGPLRCLIRLLHCSISHFKRQPTLSNIYHRTDPILELIYPICSGQSSQNQMMLGMTKSTPQKAASVWQERTQGVSRGPLSKSEQLCLPRAAWGHAARQLCSQRSRSYSLHIWRGCGTSSSPMEQAGASRIQASFFFTLPLSPRLPENVWGRWHPSTRLSRRMSLQIQMPTTLGWTFLAKKMSFLSCETEIACYCTMFDLSMEASHSSEGFGLPVLYNLINQKYPSGLWKCSVTPGKDVSWRLLKCGPHTSSSNVPWAFKGVVFQACTATPLNQKLPFRKALGPSHSCTL